MSTFNLKPTGELHTAWRVTYTHISGEEHSATLCNKEITREGLENYLKGMGGIAEIDSVATLHIHNSLCEDQGPSSEDSPWGQSTMEIKWSRRAA